MKTKRIFKISLAVILAAIVIVVFFSLKGKKEVTYRVETLPDGEGLVFYSYNKNNEKVLELKCKESQDAGGGKTVLKHIEALFLKKGRRNEDIRLYGDEGYVKNNFYDFYVEKNARIVSNSFNVSADNFYMKDQAEVYTEKPVTYSTDSLKGTANAGMGLYFSVNTLKFYNTVGTYVREEKKFDYRTAVMWIIEKDQLLVMEKDAEIREKDSFLKSEWISLKFTPDFKQIVESTSQKNSYLYYEDTEKKEYREIKAEIIKSAYDEKGRLTQLTAMQNADVLLRNKNNHIQVASPFVEMNYEPSTGKPKNVKIPMRGIIENMGKTHFKVIADVINLLYNDKGEPKICDGIGHSDFVVEKYNGATAKLNYDIEKNRITINGDNSQLSHERNTFRSSLFNVDSKNKLLTTQMGIKAIIQLEGDNAIFSKDPVFINAKKFMISEKDKKSTYEGEMSLTQGSTVLTAASMEIGKDSNITATGNVSLNFKDTQNGKIITLKGDKLIFYSKEKRIDILGSANIKNDEVLLKATSIIIGFNSKNEIEKINGEKKVAFTKTNLSGFSEKINWLYKENAVILTGSPYIIKRVSGVDNGKTTGRILRIDVKTEKITVLSDESSRTETIIKQ